MITVALPSGGTLTYLERLDWDDSFAARRGYLVPRSKFRSLTLHHTVSIWRDAPELTDEIGAMRRLRIIRPDLGLDVPYSFVVFKQQNPLDVVVAEGRGWERTGAHTPGRNSSSYGVAFYGDYRTDELTTGAIEGVRWIGAHIQNPEPTQGHRDSKATICPGDEVYAAMSRFQPPFKEDAMDPVIIARIEELEAIVQLSKDPEELVDAAYEMILKRKADRQGRAHWIAFLEAGGSVAQMKQLFELSPEAQK